MLYITHMPNKVITISLDNWQALDKLRNRIGTEKKYESFNTVVSRLLGKAVAGAPKSKVETVKASITVGPQLTTCEVTPDE